MRCPRCGDWLLLSQTVCGKCGSDLTAFHQIDAIRGYLTRTSEDFQAIARRLQSLQESLASFASALAANVAAPAKETPRPREETPAEVSSIADLVKEIPAPAAQEPPPAPQPRRPDAAAEAFKRMRSESVGHAVSTPPPFFDRAAEVRLGQKWLLIIGIIVMVLGVGYFLKYAFDQNWIGPVGRVAMAYAGGAACLAIGEHFRRKGLAAFGLYLVGGGIAVLYFSGYAAFQVYHLIGQPTAFGLMVAVTALAGLLALAHDVMWLAVLGIIGGFLTPVILSTKQDNQIALMTYMTILNGGILWIAAFKRWGLLNGLGFAFTWLLFLVWYGAHYEPVKFIRTTVFLNIFFAAYAIVPFAYYFVPRDQSQRPGFAITFLNMLIAFGVSYAMIREYASTQAVSMVSLAYGTLYFAMAVYLRRRNPQSLDAFVMLVAMAVLFFVITVPLYFSRHWITVCWAVQAAVLLWAAVRIVDERLFLGGIFLLFITLCKFALHDLINIFHLDPSVMAFTAGFAPAFAERWLTSLTVLAATFAGATVLGYSAAQQKLSAARDARNLLLAIFGIVTFTVLNMEVAGYFYDYARPARFAAISVLWALFALALMILGFARSAATLRRCSLVLFAVTLLKVFLWDMAHVSTPYRIISFLVVGILLIGASYLYHRFRIRIIPASATDSPAA